MGLWKAFSFLVVTLTLLDTSSAGPVIVYRRPTRSADCKSTASNLQEAVLSVTKARDVRAETEIIMKPYANWEEFLMPAPLSIAILGELASISSAQGDFSINLQPPQNGYKYMQYPESFSASLMQVCNKAWHAFNTANKNMDQIRLLTASIPNTNREIVQILFQPTHTVNALLPNHLSSLLLVSNNCVALAQTVENSFSDAIYLVQELLEACLSSKKGYEDKLRDVKIALEQLAIKEQSSKKSLAMAEEFRTNIKSQLDDAAQAYKKAMESIPSVWDMLAATFVEGILDTLHLIKYPEEQTGDTTPAGSSADTNTIVATNNICSKTNQLLSIAQSLKELVNNEGNINMKMVYDEKEQTVTTNYVKKLLNSLKTEIEKELDCNARAKTVAVTQSGISICEELESSANSENRTELNLKHIAQNIQTQLGNTLSLDSFCKSATNAQVLLPKAPNSPRGGGLATKHAQMAHVRVEEAREQLQKTQQMYMKSYENLKEQNEKLTAILVEMKSQQLDKIDFEVAKKMLIKGLDALGRVKEQWEKMIRFFQMMTNLIESCLVKSVNDFVTSAKSVQEIPNYRSDAFIKDLIYTQTFRVSNIAQLVNMISGTYSEVSQKHLMDRVSSLGRLIVMNPSSQEFRLEREKLHQGCTEAQNAILALVKSKKQEFDLTLEARVATINCQLAAAIPAIPAEEKKLIDDALKQGRDDAQKAYAVIKVPSDQYD